MDKGNKVCTIIEVRILVELDNEQNAYHWLKENLKKTNAIDWEQGDSYPESEAPLQ